MTPTICPSKYVPGFAVLRFSVVVRWSALGKTYPDMRSSEMLYRPGIMINVRGLLYFVMFGTGWFTHILQGCSTGIVAIIRLPQRIASEVTLKTMGKFIISIFKTFRMTAANLSKYDMIIVWEILTYEMRDIYMQADHSSFNGSWISFMDLASSKRRFFVLCIINFVSVVCGSLKSGTGLTGEIREIENGPWW